MNSRPLMERFYEKFQINEATGCWDWTASKNHGYGQIGVGNRPLFAHRVSFEMHVGPIKKPLQVDHVCRNRACVNPAHLRLLTRKENILCGAGASAMNVKKTHCPSGHAYDDANTYLYPNGERRCRTCAREDQRRIRRRRKDG